MSIIAELLNIFNWNYTLKFFLYFLLKNVLVWCFIIVVIRMWSHKDKKQNSLWIIFQDLPKNLQNTQNSFIINKFTLVRKSQFEYIFYNIDWDSILYVKFKKSLFNLTSKCFKCKWICIKKLEKLGSRLLFKYKISRAFCILFFSYFIGLLHLIFYFII